VTVTVTGVRTFRVAASIFWAVAALLVGHEVAYRFAFTDAEVRAHALEHSGHGWLGLVLPVSVMALAAGLVASVLVGRAGAVTRRRAFTAHVVVQVGAFLALEVGERLLTGHGARAVAAELTSWSGLRLLAVGVLAQVLCAFVVSVLARGAETIGALFASRPLPPAGSPVVWRPLSRVFASQRRGTVVWSRGPPAAVATTPMPV
jgi:hypothetical protein